MPEKNKKKSKFPYIIVNKETKKVVEMKIHTIIPILILNLFAITNVMGDGRHPDDQDPQVINQDDYISPASNHPLYEKNQFVKTYMAKNLSSQTGKMIGGFLKVQVGIQNVGAFVYGPYATDWPIGGAGSAIFNLSIDDATKDDEPVARLDIYNASSKQVITEMWISRRDFAKANTFQSFRVYFSTNKVSGLKYETRVFTYGNANLSFSKIKVEIDNIKHGLPKIVNQSDASDQVVKRLVERAVIGLGFKSQKKSGELTDYRTEPTDGRPNSHDLIYVNNHFIAWIDQTGFVGKMNGLWQLNSNPGALDFVLTERQRDFYRPINMLIVGEQGKGKWRGSYKGAEHFEMPNNTKEPSYKCKREICGWYAYNEALPIERYTGKSGLDWWRACNYVNPSLKKIFRPIKIEQTHNTFEIIYEDRMVKMADNSEVRDGADCGMDYLSTKQNRSPLFLRTGYKFNRNTSFVDRLYQYRNGHESLELPFGWQLIGGFVITDLHDRYEPKSFYKYHNWTNGADGRKDISVNKYAPLYKKWPDGDVIVAWAHSSYVSSSIPRTESGKSIGMSHPYMGKSKSPQDIGTCLCVVHGGYEMGGSVLSENTGGMPLTPGQVSDYNVRRLWLPTTDIIKFHDGINGSQKKYTNLITIPYTKLQRQGGRDDGDGYLITVQDLDQKPNLRNSYVIYGPYVKVPAGKYKARYTLQVDVTNRAFEDNIATIDINDAKRDKIIRRRTLKRKEFDDPYQYKVFEAEFTLEQEALLETRIIWHGDSYMKFKEVSLMR